LYSFSADSDYDNDDDEDVIKGEVIVSADGSRFYISSDNHYVALNDKGELFTWGNREHRQLGH
jgi:alpha-tubulin suppressor-like RCC1 family protein